MIWKAGISQMGKRKINRDELRSLLDEGMSVQEICRQLNVSGFAVYENMRAIGIPTAKQRKRAEKQREKKRCIREKRARMAKTDAAEEMEPPARERDYWTHKVCEECGKEFAVQNCDMYVYKLHRGKKWHYYCSWGCYRRNEQ